MALGLVDPLKINSCDIALRVGDGSCGSRASALHLCVSPRSVGGGTSQGGGTAVASVDMPGAAARVAIRNRSARWKRNRLKTARYIRWIVSVTRSRLIGEGVFR